MSKTVKEYGPAYDVGGSGSARKHLMDVNTDAMSLCGVAVPKASIAGGAEEIGRLGDLKVCGTCAAIADNATRANRREAAIEMAAHLLDNGVPTDVADGGKLLIHDPRELRHLMFDGGE